MVTEESKKESKPVIEHETVNPSFDPISQFLNTDKKPAFYANGFQAGLTHSECYIIFMQNNAQKVALTLPLPTIKSLKQALIKIEADYENQYGIKVLSIEELMANKQSNTKK